MRYLLILTSIVIILAVWMFFPNQNKTQKLKEQNTIQVPAEAQKFMDKTLTLIQKNDMRGLFGLMSNQDEVKFEEYMNGLFATNDFCPAKVIGAVKLKNNSRNIVSIQVKSEKRSKVYQFNLIQQKKGYAITSVSSIE